MPFLPSRDWLEDYYDYLQYEDDDEVSDEEIDEWLNGKEEDDSIDMDFYVHGVLGHRITVPDDLAEIVREAKQYKINGTDIDAGVLIAKTYYRVHNYGDRCTQLAELREKYNTTLSIGYLIVIMVVVKQIDVWTRGSRSDADPEGMAVFACVAVAYFTIWFWIGRTWLGRKYESPGLAGMGWGLGVGILSIVLLVAYRILSS